MSYLWDMCSELFWEIEEDELVPGQFDSPPTKKLHTEVEKEVTKVGEAAGVINPSGSTSKVYTDQLPIPCDLGVPADYLPHWESVKRRGPRGVINQFLIIPACFVTTGHRTGLPPSPIPIITLMWLLHAVYACSPVSPQGHWRTILRMSMVASSCRNN